MAVTTPERIFIERILNSVESEILHALAEHPPIHSAHEGYAVILEELDELKAEVWKRSSKRNMENMREEAIQVAAMAVRFILDVCDN